MTIAEIKTQLPIIDLLNHYGLKPDRNNRLCCPWHSDKTPSLQIYPKTNTWTCFSSNCDAGSGDQIDFIMKYEKITKHEAILKAKYLIDPMHYPLTEIKTQKMLNSEIPTTTSGNEPKTLPRIAVLTKYYQSSLGAIGRSKRAMDYAKSRNLNTAKLGIGYSGTDIGKTWNKNLQLSGEQIGILKKTSTGTYTPKIRYCLLFAMKNKAGQIVDVYGRSVIADEKGKKDSCHFYLSGVQQGLYPGYPNLETNKLILTECLIDAASLLNQPEITGEYGVLSLYGTNGFTDEHRGAIRELPDIEEVVLFFDGDEAGEKAIRKWTPEIQALKKNLQISYVNTPKGEDVNSLLQSLSRPGGRHEPEILQYLIKERQLVKMESELFFSSDEVSQRTEKEEAKEPIERRTLDKLDTTNSELLTYTTAEVRITILGGIRITGLDRMKVTLKIERRVAADNHQIPSSSSVIRHSLDLYHAKQVDHLCEMIASSLELRSSRARSIISQMTTALETCRERRLEAMKPKALQLYEMTPRDKQAGLKYLKDELLMVNTSKDIKASGIVGEEKNAMIGYVIYLSRKREKPLHVMYLGASGSGKTHVQEGLAGLTPSEDRIEATGLSDQALYYEGLKLKGKILFIEDTEGAENIMYIIRELQSKGRIIKRVAWRDNKGHTQTIEVIAEGPVVISSCTTHERVYEDNANRCILLYIDQSKEQDKRVMDYIKSKSTGRIKESDQQAIRHKIQNVQRLLRPIKVYNPYADLIDLPSEVFKPRRSLPLLLGFIETVTFYHQYQREVKTDKQGRRYIESTYEDIQISFDLLKDVLFNKSDELTKAAREFLELLKTKVKKGETFYTKKIRKEIRMNVSNLKRYMIELQRYDYIKIKGGSRYRGYEYEITDYGEYENLKSSIDKRLEDILLKIKELSGPVVQSGSFA